VKQTRHDSPERPRPRHHPRSVTHPPARRELGPIDTILALQATAGNLAVNSVIQRAPAQGHGGHGPNAGVADMRAEGALLAMHVGMLFGPDGKSYRPADTAGLNPSSAAFMTHLYQVMFNRRLGGSDAYDLPAKDREADLTAARALMPVIGGELALDPSGLALVGKINATLTSNASDITYSAMLVRARSDAELQAQLISRPAVEARASVVAALQNGWKSYSRFAEMVQNTAAVAAKSEAVRAALQATHLGLDTISKVAKSLDPESYRKAVNEAREWCHEHHAGAVMGSIRAVQVETEMIELTVGTLNAVVKNIAGASTLLLAPGHNLTKSMTETIELLEHLGEEAGLSSSGKAALKLGKIFEKLEKLETVLSAVSVVGGIAKAITADTTGEKVDAGVDITTGALQIGSKVLGRAALGSAATGVLATWEMVKFFGEMGLGAIEGSMWGGLQQELTEIQQRGDRVAVALVSLTRAVDERSARFSQLDVTSPDRSGADDAVDKLAHDFQKDLKAADRRWRESTIHALAEAYHGPTRQSVMIALQDGYPGDLVAQTGIEFMQALADAYRNAPDIVDQMLVDQGYLKPEQAEKRGRERAKRRAEAAGGAKKEE
jgi:hypothetical protein